MRGVENSTACRVNSAEAAEINKRVSPHTLRHSFASHLLEQNTDIRVIQVLLGHSKLENTALYARVAIKTVNAVMSPLEHIAVKLKEIQSTSLTPGADAAAGVGGRGYFPRPWFGMASSGARVPPVVRFPARARRSRAAPARRILAALWVGPPVVLFD